MRVAWVVLSITAVVVAGVFALGFWIFWPLVDPEACKKAEQALRAQAPVIASLPRALTAEVEPTNGCDSGDGGYTIVRPDPDLTFSEVDRLLRQAGWSTSDEHPPAEYEKRLNGETWHLSVEEVGGRARSIYLELD